MRYRNTLPVATPGAWHAMQSYLSSHRGNAGSIQRITAIELRGRCILARTVQHRDRNRDVSSGRRSFPVVYQNLPRKAGRTEPAFPGSLRVHCVFHRTRHDRGAAWISYRAGADRAGADAQSATDACSAGLAGRIDRSSYHPCRNNHVLAPPTSLRPKGH